MALLSNFVVVDLSVRSGQLQELAKLVQDTYIPFVTIAREGTKVTAMQSEFRHFYWYRSEYFPYKDPAEIPTMFDDYILPWAKETNAEIIKKKGCE